MSFSTHGVGLRVESKDLNHIEAFDGANLVFRVGQTGDVYADGTFNGGGADRC